MIFYSAPIWSTRRFFNKIRQNHSIEKNRIDNPHNRYKNIHHKNIIIMFDSMSIMIDEDGNKD